MSYSATSVVTNASDDHDDEVGCAVSDNGGSGGGSCHKRSSGIKITIPKLLLFGGTQILAATAITAAGIKIYDKKQKSGKYHMTEFFEMK